MNVPAPKKTASGWRIQLRLGGESIPITDTDKTRCIRQAEAIKAEWKLNGVVEKQKRRQPTLREAIDYYIAERRNSVSPATVRSYNNIRDNRFQSVMDRRLDSIKPSEWQRLIDAESADFAPKTVRNSWGLIKSVLLANGCKLPDRLTVASNKRKRAAQWLDPEEIKRFVKAAAGSPYCIPMLLALMSMRISEIDALMWEGIDPDADFIHTMGSRVMDEHHHYVIRDGQKTEESDRAIPLLIPELRQAIKDQYKPCGKLLDAHQMTLRRAVESTCTAAGVPKVTVHQLRHSFASLSAHLGIPKEISMEIGGWSNDKIMDEIYTHIARSDIERYKTKMWDFYNDSTDVKTP